MTVLMKRNNRGNNRNDDLKNFSDDFPSAFSPYNFVGLPKQVLTLSQEESSQVRAGLHGEYMADRHHGVIHLKIETLTPMYTKSALEINQEGSQSDHRYDFYHHGDRNNPVIPGSSLRGMLRMMVEIASRGYLETPKSYQLPFYHRFMAPIKKNENLKTEYFRALKNNNQLTVRAGYIAMRHGEPLLYPAKPITTPGVPYNFVRVKSDDLNGFRYDDHTWLKEIYFQPARVARNPNRPAIIDVPLARVEWGSSKEQGWLEGRLVKTGEMQKKKHEYVFGMWDESHAIKVPEEVWESFKMDFWQRSSGQTYDPKDSLVNEWSHIIRDEVDIGNQYIPIFYVAERNKVKYIGATKMMGIPDKFALKHVIPEQVRLPDEKDFGLDLASAMFGYVNQDSHEAIRGRVIVSDAIWKGNENPFLDDEYLVPFTLNGPKPAAFQMYLKQNGNGLVTYHDQNAEIRGRKMYWHKPWVKDTDLFAKHYDAKNLKAIDTVMRPVKKGQLFYADIRFYNLSDAELGVLLWVITLDPAKYAFHLGMGKPLGMGSVKLETILELENRQARYRRLFDGGKCETGQMSPRETKEIEERCIAEFKQMIASDGNFDKDQDIRDLLGILELNPQIEHERIANYMIGDAQKNDIISNLTNYGEKSNNYIWKDGYRSQWSERVPLKTIHGLKNLVRGNHGSQGNEMNRKHSDSNPMGAHGGNDRLNLDSTIKTNQVPKPKLIRRGDSYDATVINHEGGVKYKLRIVEGGQEVKGDFRGSKLMEGQVVKVKILDVNNNNVIKKVQIMTK